MEWFANANEPANCPWTALIPTAIDRGSMAEACWATGAEESCTTGRMRKNQIGSRAVTQAVYFANMALLDRRACRMVAESVGMARASPSRPAWLETALFTAPAGNSPLS